MSASIELFSDNILQTALEYRRRDFLNGLPSDLPADEKELRWNAHIITLSNSSIAASDTRKPFPTPASTATRHAAPRSPTPAPETKKRRLNSDVSHHAPNLSITTQYSQPHPASHVNKYEDGPSPFVKTGASVAAPILRHHSTHSRLEHPQDSSQTAAPLPISQRRGSSASQSRHVAVQEYAPADLFGAIPQLKSAASSPMGPSYQCSSTTLQSSPLQSSSPQSSFGGMSAEASTNPTSVSMSRIDSTGGSSFQKSFGMMRVSSTTSPNGLHGFSMTSPLDPLHKLEFTSSQGTSLQPMDPAHDITQTGAQFASHEALASAPEMQRRKSSNSRQLHPKQAVAPSMSRTSSSGTQATSHEIVRVKSEDGSIKEAIKISPASSYVKPLTEKVMCPHEGCTSQPGGFKGDHEMRRHYDRDHTSIRRVYVCAPLADDPTFLSKTNCKQCDSLKRYNEDYNAGEHLRRMHFNPKPPKTRRGKLTDAERRGGKGGGTEPPMSILRKFMFAYQIDADGRQISDPEKVDPSSNIMIPSTSISSQPCATGIEALNAASSSSVTPKLERTEGACTGETVFATNTSPNSNAFHLRIAVEKPEVVGIWDNAGGSSDVEIPAFASAPFDPASPAIDLNNDPVFFESNSSDVPAPFGELRDFFSAFTPSSM